jgi:copper ion binding protein
MKIFGFVICTMFILGLTEAVQASVTDTLVVKGMSCGMCERRIEKNIKKLSGVESIEADVEHGQAILVFDPAKTSKDSIERAISKLGYDAGAYSADKLARENLPGCCNPNAKH